MSSTLILGQMLWPNTPQPPHLGWGAAIEADRVVATGPHADLRACFAVATAIEATNCPITPAFVNAHHRPLLAGVRLALQI